MIQKNNFSIALKKMKIIKIITSFFRYIKIICTLATYNQQNLTE
jgi:hypothetical protein